MKATNDFSVINASILVLVSNIKSASFAHIKYESIEKLPKKLGLEGVVTKVSEGVCQVNYSYENAVNNRLEKQGNERTFEAQTLPWGKWFVNNLVIEHNGTYYLRIYSAKNNKFDSAYFVNGRPATEDEIAVIKAYKATRKVSSNTQSACGLDDNQVIPRNIKFDNIISFTCGATYTRNNEVVALAK